MSFLTPRSGVILCEQGPHFFYALGKSDTKCVTRGVVCTASGAAMAKAADCHTVQTGYFRNLPVRKTKVF
ncbi:MAG: hypothetical protein ACLRNI_09075 [Sutterella wadsworthensis]